MQKTGFLLSNRQMIQIISILGILVSLIILFYVKIHSQLFIVGGPFQSFISQMGLFRPLIFILLQIIQVIYSVIPGGMTCVLGHDLWTSLWHHL